MNKALLVFFLAFFLAVPQQGMAKLSAPFDLDESAVQQRTARLEWQWNPGGGTISDFEIDVGIKRGDNPATLDVERNFPVEDCEEIADWTLYLAGSNQRGITIRGVLEAGESYCWKVMARAAVSTDNSEFSQVAEFKMQQRQGPQCNNDGDCDAGEDAQSCPADCRVVPPGQEPLGGGPGGEGPAISDLNPISSQTLGELLENVLNFLFGLSLVILPIIIIYGGFQLLIARGDPQRIAQGRTILLWAVVAFAIILLARGLPAVLRNLL